MYNIPPLPYSFTNYRTNYYTEKNTHPEMHHIFLLFSKEGTTTVCYVRHIDNFRIHSTLYKLHILCISFFSVLQTSSPATDANIQHYA